jgi:hypothetical protein
MKKGLQIKYLYHDTDIIEVYVSIWNGRFGGSTRLYVARGELLEVAATIEGFPSGPSDFREIVLGAFGPGSAGGAVRLNLFCTDFVGHAKIRLEIEGDNQDAMPPESANIVSRIEAAALDMFVPQLRQLDANLDGEAILEFTNL